MSDRKKRFSVNFDLSIDALEKNYSDTSPKSAYQKIERFMEKENYIHVQGSGYHSVNKIKIQEAYDTIYKLKEEYPWLNNSVKSMYITEIGKTYDATHLFDDTLETKRTIEAEEHITKEPTCEKQTKDRTEDAYFEELKRSFHKDRAHEEEYEY